MSASEQANYDLNKRMVEATEKAADAAKSSALTAAIAAGFALVAIGISIVTWLVKAPGSQ